MVSNRQQWLNPQDFFTHLQQQPDVHLCAWAPTRTQSERNGYICACRNVVNPNEPDPLERRCHIDINAKPIKRSTQIRKLYYNYKQTEYVEKVAKLIDCQMKVMHSHWAKLPHHSYSVFSFLPRSLCNALPKEVGSTVATSTVVIPRSNAINTEQVCDCRVDNSKYYLEVLNDFISRDVARLTTEYVGKHTAFAVGYNMETYCERYLVTFVYNGYAWTLIPKDLNHPCVETINDCANNSLKPNRIIRRTDSLDSRPFSYLLLF